MDVTRLEERRRLTIHVSRVLSGLVFAHRQGRSLYAGGSQGRWSLAMVLRCLRTSRLPEVREGRERRRVLPPRSSRTWIFSDGHYAYRDLMRHSHSGMFNLLVQAFALPRLADG